MSTPSSFWTEHNDDMHDPAYALAFARESQRVAAVDRIMNQLDAVRIAKGIPKTQLARVVGTGEAALRRLFSCRATANPTIATLEAAFASLACRRASKSRGSSLSFHAVFASTCSLPALCSPPEDARGSTGLPRRPSSALTTNVYRATGGTGWRSSCIGRQSGSDGVPRHPRL